MPTLMSLHTERYAMSTFQRDEALLEEIIDRQGLHAVLDMLGAVCGHKANHLASNWQDRSAARKWTQAADRFHRLEAWARKTGPA